MVKQVAIIEHKKIISEILYRLRVNKCFTISKLSRKSGIPRNAIYALEKGKSNYNIETALKYLFAIYENELLKEQVINEILLTIKQIKDKNDKS